MCLTKCTLCSMMPAKRLNAAKFSLNNGRDKSGSYNHSTAQYDILRLDPVGNDTSTDYTKDRIVYSLSDNTLTLTAPTLIETVKAGSPANSKKVYAYFYGGADGEYAAWPGKTNLDYKYYDKVHNRVHFTVGENNTKDHVLQLTCEDEMAPAYLRLYEHIDEWKPDEWGSPTFIFKIKQTHVYSDTFYVRVKE